MEPQEKNTVPPELREKLLQIALATDCVAEYRVERWRTAAVSAARWLLRTAAKDEMPRSLHSAVRAVADLARAASSDGEIEWRTKSGQYALELEGLLGTEPDTSKTP